MSNDYLNLINPNYTLLSQYLNKSPAQSGYSPQMKQNQGANLRNQYLRNYSVDERYNVSNTSAQNQSLQLAAERELINNHQTLKNLIDMIDNRKTTRTANKFSLNNHMESQRENRFMRKSTDGLKVLVKKSKKEDLRQVKEKLFEVVRLIDRKLEQSQILGEDEFMLRTDLKQIKQQLVSKKQTIDFLKNQDINSYTVQTFQSHQPFIKYEQKTSPQQQLSNKRYLETNGSINQFNQLSVMKPKQANLSQNQPLISSLTPQNNLPPANNPQFSFTGTFRQTKLQQSNIPHANSINGSNQFQNKQVQLTRVSHSYQPFPNLPVTKSHQELRLMSNRNSHSTLMFLSPRSPVLPSSPPKIMIRYERPLSLNNNRYLDQQTVISKTLIPSNLPSSNYHLLQHPRPLLNRAPSPPIIVQNQIPAFTQQHPYQIYASNTPSFVPKLTFNNDQLRRNHVSPLPSDSKTTLQSNSNIIMQQSSTRNSGLKKISKGNNKFSFIQYFEKNPQFKEKTEIKRQNFEIQQAPEEIDFQFPQPFSNHTPSTVENPFKNWNEHQRQESFGLPDDSKFSKESLKSVVEVVGDNSKYSIIKQMRPTSRSKQGSNNRFQSDPFEHNALVSGSGYKRKKGLQISQKFFQTHYIPPVQ